MFKVYGLLPLKIFSSPTKNPTYVYYVIKQNMPKPAAAMEAIVNIAYFKPWYFAIAKPTFNLL